jgi:hypothetical protein
LLAENQEGLTPHGINPLIFLGAATGFELVNNSFADKKRRRTSLKSLDLAFQQMSVSEVKMHPKCSYLHQTG